MTKRDKTTTEEVHQRILGNMSTSVLLFDEKLQLLFANPAAETLFSQSARHMLGKTLTELIRFSEEDINIEHDIRAGQSFTRHELLLSLGVEKDTTVNLTVLPIKGKDDRSEYLFEMIEVERWLRIAGEEIRATQQQVTQEMLRGLSHEIKNPLGGLRGAAQLLERELEADELKEYTQVIISEADRLQALVNRILGPTGLPEMKDVNIHEVLERVRSLVLVDTSHQIKIHRDYDVSIPDVKADADMLIQAILNIVKNAAEALGDQGNITFKTRVYPNHTIGSNRYKLAMCIEIIDDGPGITAEIKEKVFFPMVTGRAEGTGLGLAITQSLIQQHDGLVECSSEPGNTVFTVLLPIK